MGSSDIAQRVIALNGDIVSVRTLLRAGVDRRWLRTRIADGSWQQVFPGVVAVSGYSQTEAGLIRAALECAGSGAVVSHHTAAEVLGLRPRSLIDEPVHLTVPHGQRKRPIPGIRFHQTRRPADTVSVAGIPVTSPARTIADIAATCEINDVRGIAATAVHRGLVSVDQLVTATRPRASRHHLNLVCEELFAGAISGPECAFWRGVVQAALPVPELNVPVETEEGVRFLDGLWRRHRLGVEIDGRSVHAQAHAFDEDRRRQNQIQLGQLVLMRFTGNQVYTELDVVLTTVENFLRSRAAELGFNWRGSSALKGTTS